jgi:hypothetical protein
MGFLDGLKKGAGWIYNKGMNLGGDSAEDSLKAQHLREAGGEAGAWAMENQDNVRGMSAESALMRDELRKRMNGERSISAEQLRQGLQQNYAGQRSMAASASPQNAAMASRTAAMQMGRLGAGMSGQAALAGLQEQKQAQDALSQMILQQRGQDVNSALQSRQTEVSAYGAGDKSKSDLEKAAPYITAAAAAFSDERLKKDIENGDAKAEKVLKGLKAYAYKYKDDKHGKGDQFGPMAQDMERAGLGHAVIDTPEGKMVHGAKAALSGLALTAALAKRVSKLEGKK